MNRRQDIALFVIVAALVASWLFPPFRYGITIYEAGPASGTRWSITHPFLFLATPPDAGALDWKILLLTDLIIIAIGLSLLYALRSRH